MFLRFTNNTGGNDNNNPQMDKLINELNNKFPIDYSKSVFKLYPFSNEYGYSAVVDTLKSLKPIEHNEKTRVAVLFGESNFISLLPELVSYADLILLADIEPKLHKHTQHLQDCLAASNTPDEFIKKYCINNPIENLEVEDDSSASVLKITFLVNMLTDNRRVVATSLGSYHFLSSNERYLECKAAANKLSFAHVAFNLLNTNHCYDLPLLLKKYNAISTFFNFTNIHDYDDKKVIPNNVEYLLRDVNDYLVMYCTKGREGDRPYKTNISDFVQNYVDKVEDPAFQRRHSKRF